MNQHPQEDGDPHRIQNDPQSRQVQQAAEQLNMILPSIDSRSSQMQASQENFDSLKEFDLAQEAQNGTETQVKVTPAKGVESTQIDPQSVLGPYTDYRETELRNQSVISQNQTQKNARRSAGISGTDIGDGNSDYNTNMVDFPRIKLISSDEHLVRTGKFNQDETAYQNRTQVNILNNDSNSFYVSNEAADAIQDSSILRKILPDDSFQADIDMQKDEVYSKEDEVSVAMNEEEKENYDRVMSKLQISVLFGNSLNESDRRMATKLKKEDSDSDSDETPDYEEGIFIVPHPTFFESVKCSKITKRQVVVYDDKSLYIFSQKRAFRKFIVRVIHHPFFDNFIILVIMMNTINLTLYDYSDRNDKTDNNISLEEVGRYYTVIFTIELIVKVIAQGFIQHKNAYLRDIWNWLDFTVVLVGVLEFLPFVSLSVLKALRVLRVLRPLRSIKQFPSMRRLIDALFGSMSALANAVVFMFFIFLLFGILGVQQFPGTMYHRCRYTEEPLEDGTWPYDPDQALCRLEESNCPAGLFCKSPFDGGLSSDIDKPWEDPSIDFGITNFDHLLNAMLTIFQMITLEGWTKIMYNMMDSNMNWMAVAFSILLVLIGSFFLLNVILAVLSEALDSVDEVTLEKESKQRAQVKKSIKRAQRQMGVEAPTGTLSKSHSIVPSPRIEAETPTPAEKQEEQKAQDKGIEMRSSQKMLSIENLDDEHSGIQIINNGKDFFKVQASQTQPKESVLWQEDPKQLITDKFERTKQDVLADPYGLHSNEYSLHVRPSDDKQVSYNDISDQESAYEGSEPEISVHNDKPPNKVERRTQLGLNGVEVLPDPNQMQQLHKKIQQKKRKQSQTVQKKRKDFAVKRNTLAGAGMLSPSGSHRSIQPYASMDSVNLSQESIKNMPQEDKDLSSLGSYYAKLEVRKEISRTAEIPERAQNNFLYKLCFTIATHSLFTIVIVFMIMMNTAVLATDAYPEKKEVVEEAEMINLIFTWCFLAEMVIKLLGLGVKEYTRDGFNLFDATIVILSMIELGMEELNLDGLSAGGALSAFRGVRLLRVFKLARSWTSFRNLLKVMLQTLKDVQTFSILLIICMLILSLLGMELLGHKIKYDHYDDIVLNHNCEFGQCEQHADDEASHLESPRPNFDNIYMSFISIFVIFIGEDWNNLMYRHHLGGGWISVVFFPILFVILNLILLNLFLAILLKNFDKVVEDKNEEDEDEKSMRNSSKRLSRFWNDVKKYCKCCFKKPGIECNSPEMTSNYSPHPMQSSPFKDRQMESKSDLPSQRNDFSLFRDHSKVLGENNIRDAADLSSSHSSSSKSSISNSQSIQLSDQHSHRDKSALGVDDLKERRNSSNPGNEHGGGKSQSKEADNDLFGGDRADAINSMKKNILNNGGIRLNALNGPSRGVTLNKGSYSNKEIDSSNELELKRGFSTYDMEKNDPANKKARNRRSTILLMKQKLVDSSTQAVTTVDLRKTLDDGVGSVKKKIIVEGKSLNIFGPENGFRQFCHKMVSLRHYDNFILGLIIFSTILLTFDNPLEKDDTTKKHILKYLDYVLTFLFTLECMTNVILYGFVMNGKKSYILDGWNVLDFLIVLFANFSIVMDLFFSSSNVDYSFLKVFRLLRVLRPLRMLKRNQGLQIQVLSLMNAIPNIVNLMVIMLLVLMLFGIQGITFFKGKFFYCHTDNVEEILLDELKTMWDCYDSGGEWLNSSQNFDNVGAAMLTMFNMMTTEGWVDVMWQAVDATQIHQAPVRNNAPIFVLFFIIFLIFGALFILNAFVGVVISKFNDEKANLSRDNLLSDKQMQYVDILTKTYNAEPIKLKQATGNVCQRCVFQIASNSKFDGFILICIIFNTVCLALSWYGQSEEWHFYLDGLNYLFTVIYTAEFVIKLIAFRKDYFKEGWNVFDFTIVISAWLGVIALEVFKINVGPVSTIIRSFRIARIIKIIRQFKELQKLVNTFIVAIPELANVGSLLILFIYLYSVLGVFLFAHLRLGEEMNYHANFRDFPTASLTLFRIVTGEAWNEIMYDSSRGRTILHQCVAHQTYDEQQKDGINGCGDPYSALLFYTSFMLIVSFVLMNLFVAIILEGWYKSKMELDLKINDEHIIVFQNAWQKYDKDATGMISIDDMDNLIIDLCYKELRMISEGIDEDEDILFNLRKIVRRILGSDIEIVSLYTKWHISDGLHQIEEEDEKVKQKILNLEDTPAFKEFDRNQRLKQKLTMHLNKFIGEFKIPVYDNLTHYNFYDVLDALAKLVFTEDQRTEYYERQERIEDTIQCGEELPYIDTVCDGSKEFDALNLHDQELWLELNNVTFQPIINRLEHKGQTAEDSIIKLNQMRKIRRTRQKQNKENMDYFGDDVVDSSVIRGAKCIQKFVNAKKHKLQAEKQQRMIDGIGGALKQRISLNIEDDRMANDNFMAEVERDLSILRMDEQTTIIQKLDLTSLISQEKSIDIIQDVKYGPASPMKTFDVEFQPGTASKQKAITDREKMSKKSKNLITGETSLAMSPKNPPHQRKKSEQSAPWQDKEAGDSSNKSKSSSNSQSPRPGPDPTQIAVITADSLNQDNFMPLPLVDDKVFRKIERELIENGEKKQAEWKQQNIVLLDSGNDDDSGGEPAESQVVEQQVKEERKYEGNDELKFPSFPQIYKIPETIKGNSLSERREASLKEFSIFTNKGPGKEEINRRKANLKPNQPLSNFGRQHSLQPHMSKTVYKDKTGFFPKKNSLSPARQKGQKFSNKLNMIIFPTEHQVTTPNLKNMTKYNDSMTPLVGKRTLHTKSNHSKNSITNIASTAEWMNTAKDDQEFETTAFMNHVQLNYLLRKKQAQESESSARKEHGRFATRKVRQKPFSPNNKINDLPYEDANEEKKEKKESKETNTRKNSTGGSHQSKHSSSSLKMTGMTQMKLKEKKTTLRNAYMTPSGKYQ